MMVRLMIMMILCIYLYVFLCRCTLKRELPAIPLSAHPDPSAECNVERTQSQHSSDLYAAVGDVNDGKNRLYTVEDEVHEVN